MSALATRPRPKLDESRMLSERNVAPIVAAVDGSAASRAAIGEAVRLAVELSAPMVFVYVRRGPPGVFGAPVYQRRLTTEMARARRVLDRALAVADSARVPAEGEILEGSPRRRISEFARDRSARLIVVGSRPRKLGQSVSRGVIRSAGSSRNVYVHSRHTERGVVASRRRTRQEAACLEAREAALGATSSAESLEVHVATAF